MRLRGQTEDCIPPWGWREARPKAIPKPLSFVLRYSGGQDMRGTRVEWFSASGAGALFSHNNKRNPRFGSIAAVKRFVERLTIVIA